MTIEYPGYADYSRLWQKLPPNEREGGTAVAGCLQALHTYEEKFADSLRLYAWCDSEQRRLDAERDALMTQMSRGIDSAATFDWSAQAAQREKVEALNKPSRQLSAWKRIAARDAVMTLFHFGKSIEGLNNFSGCRSLSKRIDAPSARIAKKLFAKRFPHFLHARHAVAHSAELWATADSAKANAIKGRFHGFGMKIGNVGHIQIQELLSNHTYVNTIGGRAVSCELSQKSYEQLCDIRKRFVDVYFPPESLDL